MFKSVDGEVQEFAPSQEFHYKSRYQRYCDKGGIVVLYDDVRNGRDIFEGGAGHVREQQDSDEVYGRTDKWVQGGSGITCPQVRRRVQPRWFGWK